MSKAHFERENYDESKPIRIWFGNLEKYNEGILRGMWLSLPMDEDLLKAAMADVLGDSEEWLLNDWECSIEGLVCEHADPIKLNSIAEELEKLDSFDFLKVAYLIENEGYGIEEAIEKYEDVVVYEGMRPEKVAEVLVDDGCFGDIPDALAGYIDYKAIARDLVFDGYHYDVESSNTYHFMG